MTAIVRAGLPGLRMSRAVWNPSPAVMDAPMSMQVSMPKTAAWRPEHSSRCLLKPSPATCRVREDSAVYIPRRTWRPSYYLLSLSPWS